MTAPIPHRCRRCALLILLALSLLAPGSARKGRSPYLPRLPSERP